MTPKNLISSALLGTSACGLLIGAALAQPQEAGGGMFERLDTNNDGVISAAERTAAREEAFRRADKDGDGYLTEADKEAAKQQREASGEERRPRGKTRGERPNLDTDGDGRISRAEFMAAENPRLARIDTDGDGNISKEEAEAAEQKMRGKFSKRRESSDE